MAALTQPITVNLTRVQIEEALEEWMNQRFYTSCLKVTEMRIHSSGGHAATVTFSAEPEEKTPRTGDAAGV